MTTGAALHPLTRGLLWVLGLHSVLGLLLVLTGHDTVLQHVAGFLLARGHHDSWEPMRQALAYVRSAGAEPLYEVVFFQRGVIFTYPTTSLLFLEGVGAVTGHPLAADGPLNVLSWIAVATTIGASTLLLRDSHAAEAGLFAAGVVVTAATAAAVAASRAVLQARIKAL